MDKRYLKQGKTAPGSLGSSSLHNLAASSLQASAAQKPNHAFEMFVVGQKTFRDTKEGSHTKWEVFIDICC